MSFLHAVLTPTRHNARSERIPSTKFDETDLLQLPNYRIYLKLMIDGTPSTPLSAVTVEPQDRIQGKQSSRD